jgi:hypothetical protein
MKWGCCVPGRLPAGLIATAFCAGLALVRPGVADATEPTADGTQQTQAVPQEPEATQAEPEFKPPPGYKTRKRGDKVVYCRKELVEGTRFTKDKCYDRVQLKEIEALMEQQRREMDQRRRICPQPTACG